MIGIYIASSSNSTLQTVKTSATSIDGVVKSYCDSIKKPNAFLTIPSTAIDRCNVIDRIV